MLLSFTPKAVEAIPANTHVPSGAATAAALDGDASLLSLWLVAAIKRQCHRLAKDPAEAEKFAADLLATVQVEVKVK